MSNRPLRTGLLSLAAFLAFAQPAWGGSFGVSPIRVDLDRSIRTGLVTVSNDDTRRLNFQMKLHEWTQDEKGQDRYAESSDLIFFPQIMTVEPGEKRVIRIGSRGSNPAGERAYRLFIEELPDPAAANAQGAQVAVLLRFGVPVFVAPPSGSAKPEITGASLHKGRIGVQVRNSGTRHIRFEDVVARAGNDVIGKAGGWYVFPGVTRTFDIPVAKENCRSSGALEIRASSEGRDISHSIEAGPVLCAP